MADLTFEQKIAAAKSATEIAEICKAQYEMQGVLVRNRDGSVEVRESITIPPPAPKPPEQSGDTLLRRAVTLPNGTIRVIEGFSNYGLDILENALKKQFGL